MSFTSRRLREEKPSRWKPIAASLGPLAIRMAAILAGVFGKWKARREKQERDNARLQVLKKSLVILTSVLLGLVLLAGTVQALVGLRILTLSTFFSVAGSDLPSDEHGFTNVLLLGSGDKSHQGVDLTDAIMVASLDPWKTRSAVLLSLPRDLYVLSTENMGRGRINELYRNFKYKLQRGGLSAEEASMASLQELARELTRQLGLPIHHVAKVDFIAFVKGVDALGGVDLDVPEDIVDPEYPGPNYTYETFAISKGPQHLDGETALKYARSRHTTSDFDRSSRQQLLLQALAEKARSEGITRSPGKITSLLKILSEHVETTMSFGEIVGAAKLAERIDRSKILSYNLGVSSAMPGGFLYPPPREQFEGASVLLPASIPEFPVTWKQIQTFVRVITQHRTIALQKPSIAVLNAGATTGLARLLGNELSRYGFNVEATGNASDDRRNPPKIPLSVIVARTEEDQSAAEFFAALLQMPVGPLPAVIPGEKQGPVTIVLGEDYRYTPLQALLPTEE